jgi:hypothetical protein
MKDYREMQWVAMCTIPTPRCNYQLCTGYKPYPLDQNVRVCAHLNYDDNSCTRIKWWENKGEQTLKDITYCPVCGTINIFYDSPSQWLSCNVCGFECYLMADDKKVDDSHDDD